MNFIKWLREVDKEYDSSFRDKYRGRSILPNNAFVWHKEAYFTYKIIESNKGLVWATWILAIATIILAIINLF